MIYNSKFHYIIGVHLIIDDEIVGSVVIIDYKDEFWRVHCQLADIFCLAVTSALSRGNSNTELRTGSAVISDILEGRTDDASMSTDS